MDTVSAQRRSEIMSKIRSRDTKPELAVRRYLHSTGLRYRIHRRDLPGRPDIVFPSRKLCVFVHGCFWRGCPNCVDGTRTVKSNGAYGKIEFKSTRRAIPGTSWPWRKLDGESLPSGNAKPRSRNACSSFVQQ